MTFDSVAIMAAISGVLVACWSYVKSLAWRFISLLVVRAKLEGNFGDAISLYAFHELSRSPFGEKKYSTFRGYVRPYQRYQIVGFEQIGTDATVFWKGWRPIVLSFREGDNTKLGSCPGLTITFIRGLFNLEKLLVEALDLYNHIRQEGESQSDRFTVEKQFGNGSIKSRSYGKAISDSPSFANEASDNVNPEWRLLKWEKKDIGVEKSKTPWESLSYPYEVEQLICDLKRWKQSENWYRSKRIPWRMGTLIFGKPGTGKTSFVKAIAQDLDLPIIAFDLTTYGNEDFNRAWRGLMSRAPCIALLEDIDAVFKGRENRLGEEGGGLSFDCLLNCLSGVESCDGILVMITTNKIEDLDEALGVPNEEGISTRPGRIDKVIELTELDEECRYRIANKILCDCPDEIEDIVIQGNGDTGAQFQERCSSVALRRYWNDSNRNGYNKLLGVK